MAFNDIEDFVTDESFRSWVINPTPELNEQWESWKLANADKSELVEEARIFIQSLKFKRFEPEPSVKSDILYNIRSETQAKRRRINMAASWYKAAAIVTIAFALGLIYFFTNVDLEESEVSLVTQEMVQKSNPVGIKSQHMLSDGSIVFLNSESAIEYPKKFDKEFRVVSLKGEAYFEVAKDAARPFKVMINGLEVKVLGTKFNVNSKQSTPEVALVEGKVQLINRNGKASVIMKPGQKAKLDLKNDQFLSSSFEITHEIGWKDGILSFQESSFEEVVQKLHLWYGIEITLSNQPATSDWSYTASFRNESLENVLQNMSTLRNFDFEINNDSLIIRFK